ncbi:hypothetical protein MKK58_24365 [Methylobacterium sp. J-078]|uniref:hypothetical protein n=1 Tax=Methylobacterium sp. J-078 TaxID=2836657 RepID=UPI001FB9F82B|nr:hypothetical protein [Methylobacterium sp. J-078]MCJ2047649.1 hypothetical protein [Methylobacterium sp. J-078]
MTDWKKIIEAEFTEPEREGVCSFIVRGNDHDTHEYLTLKEAGAWVPQLLADEPVTLDHGVQFMASLAEVRADLNSRLSWHMLLELIAPDEDATKLIALYERETGVTDDQAFPAHLDPDKIEEAQFLAESAESAERRANWEAEHLAELKEAEEIHLIRLAERAELERKAEERRADQRRRNAPRRPIPVADPTRQFSFGFPQVAPPPVVTPQWRYKERTIVEAMVAAWLHDGRPSPMVSCTCTGRRGSLVWALGRLEEGGRLLMVFDERRPGRAEWLKYRGLDLHYDSALHEWYQA